MAGVTPTEIVTLARILGQLDYYQLLDLSRDASAGEVKRAYYTASRTYHPDSHRHLDAELREAVGEVAKRIREAYSVLRDPRRRSAYDRHLRAGAGLRIQLAEARAEAIRERVEARGRTPQGRQYFQLAQADLQRGDRAAAMRNLQTALTFEPDNAGFRELLAETRSRLAS